MSGDMVLEGVNVLDLSDSVGGAYCTKLLADLGASVILVERPGSGHPLRKAGPFPKDPDVERSGLFLYYGANKKSVACDIESETGRGRIRDLASCADIVVESFAPGHLDDLVRSRRHIALRLWTLSPPASPLSPGRRRTALLWCIRRGGPGCAGSGCSPPNP